jgi:RND family efflux transporter MFP subunit
MTIRRLLVSGGVVVAFALAGYGVWTRNAALAERQSQAAADAVPRVKVIAPERAPPTRNLTLPGQIAAWNEAQIFGQVSGYVQSWTTDYGAHVAAGEVLATIDTPTLDAQYRASEAKLKVAQAQYNIAELTSERFSKLTGSDGVAQQTIDDRNAQAEAAKATLEAAKQDTANYKAKLAFKELRSPFAGVVVARRINIGDFIDGNGGESTSAKQGQPPFTVADIHKLRVFVSVPQTLSAIPTADLKAEVTLPSEPGRSIPARFLTRSGGVESATRTIVTEFVIDHPDGALMPGAFVSVTMTFPSNPSVLRLPAQAILFRASGTQVATIEPSGKVALKDVTVGRNLGRTVEITAGLDANAKIVANPSLGLLNGETVREVRATEGY